MTAGADGADLPSSGTPFEDRLKALLGDVAAGAVRPDAALTALRDLPFADLGYARVDHHRELRQGQCEIVFAPGKGVHEVAGIVRQLLAGNEGPVLVSRADADQRGAVRSVAAEYGLTVEERPRPGAIAVRRNVPPPTGLVLVVTAGTSDLAVAEEAQLTASLMGVEAQLVADVGVAGLHRVAAVRDRIEAADAVVVMAGMEGALASVVGGLARGPVVACPTSVGYGASFGGLAALLAMLSSCAPGVVCVDIDDGVGAGFAAALIAPGAPAVTRVAFAEPVGGAAGDMLLSALLDAGAPLDAVRAAVDAVLPGRFVIGTEEVRRNGVRALHLTLSRTDGSRMVDADHAPRPLGELIAAMEGAALPEAVRERARRVLDRLGSAEARAHGTSAAGVRLHELGNDDTLVDVVGVSAALDALGVDELRVAPIPLGTGAVADGAHGPLPMPGPATLELLRGFRVRDGWRGETVTPTAAAIFAGLGQSVDAFPSMTIEGVGYGAGTDDPTEVPNVVRIVVGSVASAEAAADDPLTRELALLEANLDDLTPELVADAAAALRAAGALDAWVTPVLMKKGRPGFVLSALVAADTAGAARLVFFEHTSTFGVRSTPVARTELERRLVRVSLSEGEVRVKVGFLGGRVIRATPEHDDVVSLASRIGRPVMDVYEEAVAAARSVRLSPAEGAS